MIRQEGGLVPTTWDKALGAALNGLRGALPLAGIVSGRNTNEEAFLFAKLMKGLSPQSDLAVFYQERDLSEVEKILMSPDRSPNFRGATEMGVGSNGGFEPLRRKLLAGNFSGAYVVGEDLLGMNNDAGGMRQALEKLSFLVVQDIRMTDTAQLAHVVLPAAHFGEKEGTYTNRNGRLQKLNAATVAPEGAMQDCEIFMRLLEAAGTRISYSTPAEIFAALAAEVPAYQGLNYNAIGAQGIQLGRGAGQS
jgi:predicted molibdopterin-dependent oxidoreductase YjgC